MTARDQTNKQEHVPTWNFKRASFLREEASPWFLGGTALVSQPQDATGLLGSSFKPGTLYCMQFYKTCQTQDLELS